MKAVIPAAGLGTRFLPITKAQPKEMLPVFNKPTIQYVVEEIIASGIDDILIITGKSKRAIEDHFDRSDRLENSLKNRDKQRYLEEMDVLSNVDIHYTRQKEQKGLGDAIYTSKKYVGNEPFVVLLGDTITIDNVPCTQQMIEVFREVNSSVVAVEKVPKEKIENYGIVSVDRGTNNLFKINDLVEKPSANDAPSDYGIIGRYILTPEIFGCIKKTKPGKNEEIQITDALKILLKEKPIYAFEFKGKRYDIGNMFDWMKSSIELAINDNSMGEELKLFLNDLVNK